RELELPDDLAPAVAGDLLDQVTLLVAVILPGTVTLRLVPRRLGTFVEVGGDRVDRRQAPVAGDRLDFLDPPAAGIKLVRHVAATHLGVAERADAFGDTPAADEAVEVGDLHLVGFISILHLARQPEAHADPGDRNQNQERDKRRPTPHPVRRLF